MANIAFLGLWPEMVPVIRRKLKGHLLTFFSSLCAEKLKSAEIVGLYIDTPIKAEQIAKMKKLRLIVTFSTGFDHIDLAACKKRKIAVANVPSYGSHTVAEHTIALMLALAKKIVLSVERTRQGNFSLDGLRTIDIINKTLGIVGFGKIGINVARTARALGMTVLVFDPFADPEIAHEIGCTIASFDHVLKKSDIISLHAPLTQKTRHLINQKTLSKMKKGTLIINTARGGLIDTKALVQALASGHIGGAGLDVLEEERSIKEELQLISPDYSGSFDLQTIVANQMLCKLPNVLITPHNAFNSQEALDRIVETGLENILGFLAKKPINIVSPIYRE
jgi:D-lactate dehydrogenase